MTFVREDFVAEVAGHRQNRPFIDEEGEHWYTNRRARLRIDCSKSRVQRLSLRRTLVLGRPILTLPDPFRSFARLYCATDVDRIAAYKALVRDGRHETSIGLLIEDAVAWELFGLKKATLSNWRRWCPHLGRRLEHKVVSDRRGRRVKATSIADIEAALRRRRHRADSGTLKGRHLILLPLKPALRFAR